MSIFLHVFKKGTVIVLCINYLSLNRFSIIYADEIVDDKELNDENSDDLKLEPCPLRIQCTATKCST